MRRECRGPLEVERHVAAPPERVWSLLMRPELVRSWSRETLWQLHLPPRIRRGTWSLNVNRHGWFVWPTISRYARVVPRRRLCFYVFGPAAWWTYDLAPSGDGTAVRLRRDLSGERSSWLSLIVARIGLGGAEAHDRQLHLDMARTLEALAAAAER